MEGSAAKSSWVWCNGSWPQQPTSWHRTGSQGRDSPFDGEMSLDAARADLGWILCLQPDPPSSIFQDHQALPTTSLRPFANLADPKWISTALAYDPVLEEAGVCQSEAGGSPVVSGGLLACHRPGQGGRNPKAAESKAVGGTKSSRRSCPAVSSSQLGSSARLFDSSDCLDLPGEGEPLSPGSCRPSSERKVASPPNLCNLDSRGVRRKAAFPPGSFARRSSFWAWASSLPRLVLASKTSFARFLVTTFATCRSDSVACPTALFPLPVPAPGVFTVSVPDCDPSEVPVLSAQELLIERALHVTCMALNFLHANYRPPPLDSLRRHPSQAHLDTFGRLRAMLRACSRCTDDFSLCAGRRGTHLIARLAELTLLLKRAGLSSYPYPGSDRSGDFVPHCVGGPTCLAPYRDADPAPLRITGEGRWDASRFLGPELSMPFLEPLTIRIPPLTHLPVPDTSADSPAANLEIFKLWDSRGLLHLSVGARCKRDLCRVFGAFNE